MLDLIAMKEAQDKLIRNLEHEIRDLKITVAILEGMVYMSPKELLMIQEKFKN